MALGALARLRILVVAAGMGRRGAQAPLPSILSGFGSRDKVGSWVKAGEGGHLRDCTGWYDLCLDLGLNAEDLPSLAHLARKDGERKA